MPVPLRPMTRPLLLLLATLSLLVLASGCATRTVRHTIEENNTLVVSLVREVRGAPGEEV